MKTRLTKVSQIRALIISVIIYLSGVTLYSLWSYHQQKEQILKNIKTKLTEAALSVDYLVPLNYFDRAIAPDSISSIEFTECLHLLSRQADNFHIKYIYTTFLYNNRIFFTASSATSEEIRTGENLTYYWQEYTEADPSFFTAFNDTVPSFSSYTDRWGTFLTVLIPHENRRGDKYLLCADMEISFISKELMDEIPFTLAKALFLLLIVVPLIYSLLRNYRKYSADLEETVSHRTELLEKEIDKRIKSEDVLRQSEQKFSIAFNRVPVPMFITSINGIITDVNNAFTEATGLKKEKIIGQLILSLPFFESGVDFESIKRSVLAQGSFLNHSMKYRCKETLCDCILSAELIQLYGKSHILSIFMDISERYRYENELRIAKEKAEESDKLKTIFLANMSHEVRTPLNAVIGFSDLLRDETLDSEKRNQYIDIITSNSRNLLELINDIINISKIEAGQLKISEDECDLNKVLGQMFRWLEKEKNDRNKNNLQLKLSVSLPDNNCLILTDEIRLRQVIINLLTNALKFTESGSIEFGYNISDRRILFFVKDSGIGISKPNLRVIFERFKQVHEGSARKYGGTGLGLAISKAIVELMGGAITVESEPAKGSTFTFSVPYNPLPVKKHQRRMHDGDTSSINLKDTVILIVEDDVPSYYYFKTILEKNNAEVLHADNGPKALEIFKNRPDISVILMDLHLPEMTGYEITKEIRKVNPDVVIIAQTADALSETRNIVLSSGFSDYITKPINRTAVLEMIYRLIRPAKS